MFLYNNRIIWNFLLKAYIKVAKKKLPFREFSFVKATAPF